MKQICWKALPVVVTILVLPLSGQEATLTPERELLKKHKIHTDASGLLKYLGALNQKPQIQQLIQKLGSDSFADREAATARLGLLGVVASAELKQAAETGEVEVKNRVEQVLESIESDGKPVLFAVLKLVREARPAGAVKELLPLLAALPDPCPAARGPGGGPEFGPCRGRSPAAAGNGEGSRGGSDHRPAGPGEGLGARGCSLVP